MITRYAYIRRSPRSPERRKRFDIYFSEKQAEVAGTLQYLTHGNGFVVCTELVPAGKPSSSRWPDKKLIVKNTTATFVKRLSKGLLLCLTVGIWQ